MWFHKLLVYYTRVHPVWIFIDTLYWLVVDRHKLTVFYLKSFDMDSVQVGKAVFGKEIHTTLGIEPRTNSNPGRYGNPYSVCWVKKTCGHSPLNPSKVGPPWLPTIRLRADTILNP